MCAAPDVIVDTDSDNSMFRPNTAVVQSLKHSAIPPLPPCNVMLLCIYSIICLKSVDVRTMQFVFLAHSPREMSQTDRIHPRYFLLRVRVSIRPRYFVNAKKTIVHVCCLLRSAPLRPDEQLNSKP